MNEDIYIYISEIMDKKDFSNIEILQLETFNNIIHW